MKNRNFLVVPMILASFAPGHLHAALYTVDQAHSSVNFEVKHLSISTVRGSFPDFSGKINLNEKDFTKSKAEFNIKTKSIHTANAKRDAHLQGAEFFDVEKFPEAKFVSSALKNAGKDKEGKDKYVAEGDLTIHGVTKRAKLDVIYLGKVKDPMGPGEKVGFQATTEINRRDYGINYGPSAMISDTVKLTIDLEAAETK